MEELINRLNRVLADSFIMYFKAHAFHWNVEGVLFSQYHDFFGGIYEEVYGSIDSTAEEIRKLGYPAPMSLEELYNNKSPSAAAPAETEYNIFGSQIPQILQMLQELDVLNSAVIASLNSAFMIANESNEQGLADYIAGRLSAHKKHQWMIRSSMRSSK